MPASRIAEAYVQIVPRIDGVASKLNGQLSGELGKIGVNAGKSFGGGFLGDLGKVARRAAGIFAAIGIGNFVADAVKAGSNLQAEFEGVNQVFGKAAGTIQSFAKTASTTAGLTEVEALRSAKSMGVFATSAGLSSQASATFATQMVQLAGDLGSFNDVPTADALAAIQSGLMGETEPLRRFGVMLDDARLRQRAMAMGLIETTNQALTPQQKVLAAHAEILAQTNLQQGDFVKYASDFGNAQKTMTANFENMKSTLGTSLLPVLGQLMVAINPIIEMAGPLLFKVFQALIPIFDAVTNALTQIMPALDPLIGVFAMLAGTVGDIIVAILPPLIDLFIGLMPLISAVAGLFGVIVKAVLPPLVKLLEKVLIPIILWLADILVRYFIPYWTKLAEMFGGVLTVAIDAIVQGFQWLMKTLKPVWDAIKPLIEGFMSLMGIKPIKITASVSGKMDPGIQKLMNGKGTGTGAFDAKSLYGQGFDLGNAGKTGATSGSAAKSAAATTKKIKDLFKTTGAKISKAKDVYNKAVDSANKKFAADSAKITAAYNDTVERLTKDRNEKMAALDKDHAANVASIQKDFANKMADIIQQSKDRLRSAFESVAAVDVGKTFADLANKNVTGLIGSLKSKLKAARDLVANAGSLASAGFSQTFIEQVVSQGPDAGNAMAKAILAATPESQAELQALFAESETTAAHGMDNLANTMYEKQGLATEALRNLYSQAEKDLVIALATEETLYKEKQVEIQTAFDEGMAAAKVTRDEAMAAAQQELQNALTEATKNLNDSLRTIQKEFNDALVEFKGKLSGHAKEIAAINSDIKAARALAMEPIKITKVVETVYQPVTSSKTGSKIALADGGFVTRPTNALIGEAGPEVVTPLKDFERMMGINGANNTPTVNYYAAPNQSLDSEQALLVAMKRAKVVAAW